MSDMAQNQWPGIPAALNEAATLLAEATRRATEGGAGNTRDLLAVATAWQELARTADGLGFRA